MAERSFYEILRRRIAPIALVAALAMLGTRTCASEMAQVDVLLLLGEARTRVRSLRVDVFPEGKPTGVAYFEQHFREGGAGHEVAFQARLDPGSYELRIEVQMKDGAGARDRVLHRTIYVRDQSQVTVDLAQALGPDSV